MLQARGPRGLVGFGDALRVAAVFGLADPAEAERAFALVGYDLEEPARSEAPLPPAPQPPPVQLRVSETQRSELRPKQLAPPQKDFETEPPAIDWPPQHRESFTDLWGKTSQRPARDPFAPRPEAPNAPQKPPLFAPRHERALLRDLCRVPGQGLDLDIGALVARFAALQPVERLECLTRLRAPARIDLWFDVSESMQVFDEDFDHLERRLQQLYAGSAEVTTSRWVGLPKPGDKQLPGVERLLATQASAQAVVIATDLGLGGDPALRIGWRSALQHLNGWAAAFARNGVGLAVMAPLPASRWSGLLPAGIRSVEWSRRARPGHRPASGLRASPQRLRDRAGLAVCAAADLRRLARACALTVRITPSLLRRLRLQLLPRLGPDAEAELWSAPFVREANVFSASLVPAEAEKLRPELPRYGELWAWLAQSRFTPTGAEADVRPIRTIDDGFDDLWPGRVLPESPKVAPLDWERATEVLRGILSQPEPLQQAVAAFPLWEAELKALAAGTGILFAERLREISLRHSLSLPHLQIEETLIWHGFNAERGDVAAEARAEAVLAAVEATILHNRGLKSGRNALDWVKRRHKAMPEAIRRRPTFERLERLAGSRSGQPGDRPASYHPVDVYAVPQAGGILFSLAPLPQAYRFRAHGDGILQLRVTHGSARHAVRLQGGRAVQLAIAPSGEARIETQLGDIYVLPFVPDVPPVLSAAEWLSQADAERGRRDWIAAMRWAAKAADADAASPREAVLATTAFAEAAEAADFRIDTALARITIIDKRFDLASSPVTVQGVDPILLTALALARVELLMADSQLDAAIAEARRALAVIVTDAKSADAAAIAARLRCRLVAALLRRGLWRDAEAELDGAWAEAASTEGADSAAAAWRAVALADPAFHGGIRREGKRALAALGRARHHGDPRLACEIAGARAESSFLSAHFAAAADHYVEALAGAQALSHRSLIRLLTLRLARVTFNAGAENEAQRLLRELVQNQAEIRSRRVLSCILFEHSYQARLRWQTGALLSAKEALWLLPAEEARDRANSLYQQAKAQIEPFGQSKAFREAIEGFATNGQWGELADDASAVAFESAGDWVIPMLRQAFGGETAAESLRRAVQRLGATAHSLNILSRIAEHETDATHAFHLFQRAIRLGLAFGGFGYVGYAALQAASRLLPYKPEQDPQLRRHSAQQVLTLLDRVIGILDASKSFSTIRVDLSLWRVTALYRLDKIGAAQREAQATRQMAQQFDLAVQGVAAALHLAMLAYHTGDVLTAAKELRGAREHWAKITAERRHAAVDDGAASLEPLEQAHTRSMLIDMAESFKDKTTADATPAELAFADDLLWFANEYYEPKLTKSNSNSINDLWYVANQFRKVIVPTAEVAWSRLREAQQTLDPKSSRLNQFRAAHELVRTQLGLEPDSPK